MLRASQEFPHLTARRQARCKVSLSGEFHDACEFSQLQKKRQGLSRGYLLLDLFLGRQSRDSQGSTVLGAVHPLFGVRNISSPQCVLTGLPLKNSTTTTMRLSVCFRYIKYYIAASSSSVSASFRVIFSF